MPVQQPMGYGGPRPIGGMGGMPPPPQMQPQQQQQRLDPDAMPSVVQVIDDDKQKFNTANNIIFQTTIPAAVPPLVTTVGIDGKDAITDGGCARPNHVRSTVYQVPVSEDILKMTSIPLGIVVKPFDEDEVEGHMVRWFDYRPELITSNLYVYLRMCL